MSNFNKNINKYKKYAFRKIGKYFGPCVIGTMISLGVAVTVPSNNAHASITQSEDGANIDNITSTEDGYEVFVPKGKRYERDDTVESHKPVLKEEGYNGRSFILKAEESENLTKDDIDNHFEDKPMGSLFEKLYDEDGDDQIDEKYKRADADTINKNAGKPINGSVFLEPKVSEVNPKYPHRLDAGVATPAKPGNLYEGRPAEATGDIDSDDTIVESNKPIKVDPNLEENKVNDDGTVVLSKYYRIYVNKGEDANKKDDVYVVGTKPKVEEKEIPVTTTYVEDPNKEFGTPEVVENPGKVGKITTKTPYNVDEHTGKVTEGDPDVTTEEMIPKVVKVGTKPKVVETPISYTTRYEKDETLPKGEEREKVAGKEGKTTTTTTYTMDPNTGTVTPNKPTTVEEQPIERVVLIGAQPKVEEKEIPVTTTYVEDPNKEFGTPEVVENPGKAGKVTTKTPYNVDEHTGKVTEGDPVVTTEEMTPKVVKVGTKPKVVETPIPYTTRYVEDNTKDKDYRETTQVGVKGKETTTTTYTMDPNTGTVTENTPTVVREEPKEEIITVGTKPKVVETPETPQPEETGTKEVTRTINYVDEKGNEVEKSSTDKVKFTRESTNADWKAVDGDSTFDAVKSPVVKGYILKDPAQKVVEKETVKSDAKDETITVTYTKVGSYVPKVPEGVTPKTPLTPTPYDNNPEDPTKVVTPNPEKPQDPKDPNSPKVPVIPQVPGHTPVIPKDPTKPVSPENPLVPLTPVDPNHPEKGYNVPPVPTMPGQDTPIEYVKDGQQRAIVNFVDENGNSVAASILQTGKAGDKFTKDTLVKATISELQSKGYELRTSDYPKEGTGVFDNDSKVDQIFTVTVRKIEVLPPRPRVIERPGGNTVVEVGVPNKDADTLNIWYEKRDKPNAPKEEIVTKKDNGTWKIEKAPEGVTINPSTGIVSIPGNKIQPKTWIDTQTKHETKISKIVRVMLNISDLPEFKGITMWIEDKESKNLKDPVDGVHERGEFTGYEWKESILEGNIITHIFKKLSNPDNPKSETGINVIPPTPKIVDRPGGGGTVEVGVPNKDADTLIIKYTKRNNPNDPKEEIITKKDKDGTWKIEKSPDGVTINPTTGVVYIPSKQIEPKTFVDTQTKHGDKPSKVVSVVPNISELKEFKGITEWIDVEGKVLKPSEEGIHEKGRFDNLVWLESVLEGNKITHIFGPGTPTVDKPKYKVTVWFDKDGNPIKPDQPGTHESGKIPGYRFITTTTKDGVTVHKFEKITPVAPNKPTPENPNTPNPEKQQVKKLANTGATETNTGLAGLGLAMFGMALTAIKRRKEK